MNKLRSLTKEQYNELRRTVRKNILVNSKDVYLNRFKFTNTLVLMGGIVVQRKELFGCTSGNERIEITRFLTKEEFERGSSSATKSGWLKPIGHIKQLDFKIFDFSGFFTFLTDRGLTKEARLRFFKIKEGDLIYVIAKIIPINDSDYGYFLSPTDIFCEEEFGLYKEVYSNQFLEIKNKIQDSKLREYIETISDILCDHREGMEVIRLFLRKNDNVSAFDYFWLIDEIDTVYRRRPSKKLAQLAYKYFCEWRKGLDGMLEDPKDDFEYWHPDLAKEITG